MAGQAVTTGTVAARVQKFQDILRVDNPATFSAGAQAISPGYESGITVGQGNRVDPAFALPACRASRDGTDGSRGDGRPPVGNFKVEIFPSPHGADGTYERPVLKPAPQRPATSLEAYRNSSAKGSDSRRPSFSDKPLRSRRPTEKSVNDQTAAEDLVAIRNRLRSIKSQKGTETSTCQEPTGGAAYIRRSEATQSVLEELDDMLDNAIGENVGQLNTALEETHPIFDVAQEEHGEHQNNPATASTTPTPEKVPRAKSRSIAQAASPVKQRAAMFETIQRRASDEKLWTTHLRTCKSNGVLNRWRSPVLEPVGINDRGVTPEASFTMAYISSKEASPQKSHGEAEAGVENTIPATAHEPPISLALPQLLSPRADQSRGTGESSSESFGTAPLPDGGEQYQSSDRKVSPNWPFKWNLFSTRKAFPAAIQQSDMDMKAGEHTPPVKSRNVRSRIQSLLNASGQTELTPMPAQERTMPGFLKGSIHEKEVFVPRTQSMSPTLVKAGASGSSGLPCHPEVDGLASSSSPRRRLSAEDVEETKRPLPETPHRGRARTIERGNSPTKRRNTYSNESRFALGRSGSRGGVRIEVEIKSPRSSPQRDGTIDEQIIIIRANIDPVDEEEDRGELKELGKVEDPQLRY